ncbi:hypothetical protein EXS70_03895 [Candidatus Peribacteria bacterium]|nr:hypothetical protein [Candidatus Peribacteria bacterium]
MTSKNAFVSLGFVLILVLLGTTDAFFTRGTLRLPGADGIPKQTAASVAATVEKEGFALADTHEEFLLQGILPHGTYVSGHALLWQDDRVGAVAMVESPDIQRTLTIMRKQLQASFSPSLKDLIDETQSEPGKPPRDVLSFYDPRIHTDRIVFARVRERLYEFHVTLGKEPVMDRLVNALTE